MTRGFSRRPEVQAPAAFLTHALTKLSIVESKLFVREPLGAFFVLVFPALLLVVLATAIPGFRAAAEDLGGQRPVDIYVPILIALAIATGTMMTLLGVLAAYRERGVLRRLSTTPVSPSALLGAQLVVNAVALLVGCGLAVAVGMSVFDVAAPSQVVGFLLAFVLGTAAMGAVALLIAAVAPNTRVASGLGTLVYVPMQFFAGVWLPGPLLPDGVRRVADLTPLGAASQAMQDAWAGAWPRPLHLAVMVAYTVLAGALAARHFRWE